LLLDASTGRYNIMKIPVFPFSMVPTNGRRAIEFAEAQGLGAVSAKIWELSLRPIKPKLVTAPWEFVVSIRCID